MYTEPLPGNSHRMGLLHHLLKAVGTQSHTNMGCRKPPGCYLPAVRAHMQNMVFPAFQRASAQSSAQASASGATHGPARPDVMHAPISEQEAMQILGCNAKATGCCRSAIVHTPPSIPVTDACLPYSSPWPAHHTLQPHPQHIAPWHMSSAAEDTSS